MKTLSPKAKTAPIEKQTKRPAVLAWGMPLLVGLIASCSDFLDRDPLAQLSPTSAFNSATQLDLYTGSFYLDVLPSPATLIMSDHQGMDDIITTTLPPEVTGNRVVPVSGGGWSWSALRNINFFLQNYSKGGLSTETTAPYVAVARFFRAHFYFDKVKRFGDVPWYATSIEANDSTLLLQPRDSRALVVDSILADLDYAIEWLPDNQSVDRVSRWTALALKSRVCLYEGTWRKYHAGGPFGVDGNGDPLTGWEDLLEQCVEASLALMEDGPYTVYSGDPSQAYLELFTALEPHAEEIILARTFSPELGIFHDANFYTLATTNLKPGLEKGLVNSYLNIDGTRFTDVAGYETMTFYEETQNRDPRLSQTIRTPGYTRIGSTVPVPPTFGSSVTGYHLIKYVGDPSQDGRNRSHTPLSIFRFGETLLNFAEAKAELGTLTQADVDRSIRHLRDRVGMPNLDVADANANPDPYLAAQYQRVTGPHTGAILEIRRERRIELVMEDFRWDDLLRWREGHLLADQFYGQYFPGAGAYDLDGGGVDLVIYEGDQPGSEAGVTYLQLGTDISLENGADGGRVVVNGNVPKVFDEARDYLFPIPSQERLLNPGLSQNPKWQ